MRKFNHLKTKIIAYNLIFSLIVGSFSLHAMNYEEIYEYNNGTHYLTHRTCKCDSPDWFPVYVYPLLIGVTTTIIGVVCEKVCRISPRLISCCEKLNWCKRSSTAGTLKKKKHKEKTDTESSSEDEPNFSLPKKPKGVFSGAVDVPREGTADINDIIRVLPGAIDPSNPDEIAINISDPVPSDSETLEEEVDSSQPTTKNNKKSRPNPQKRKKLKKKAEAEIKAGKETEENNGSLGEKRLKAKEDEGLRREEQPKQQEIPNFFSPKPKGVFPGAVDVPRERPADINDGINLPQNKDDKVSKETKPLTKTKSKKASPNRRKKSHQQEVDKEEKRLEAEEDERLRREEQQKQQKILQKKKAEEEVRFKKAQEQFRKKKDIGSSENNTPNVLSLSKKTPPNREEKPQQEVVININDEAHDKPSSEQQ